MIIAIGIMFVITHVLIGFLAWTIHKRLEDIEEKLLNHLNHPSG